MGTFVLHEEIGDKAKKSGIKLFEKTCISECEYRGFQKSKHRTMI
jgi:hypothetical protein